MYITLIQIRPTERIVRNSAKKSTLLRPIIAEKFLVLLTYYYFIKACIENLSEAMIRFIFVLVKIIEISLRLSNLNTVCRFHKLGLDN